MGSQSFFPALTTFRLYARRSPCPTPTDAPEGTQKVAELVDQARICMLTTMTAEGAHVSRPMALQDVEFDGDLWFFAMDDSAKAAEITAHPQVNVAFTDDKHQAWTSVSGTATLVHDRAKMEELWAPPLKVWFADGIDTPGITLIKVHAETAEWWEASSSRVKRLIGAVDRGGHRRPRQVPGRQPDRDAGVSTRVGEADVDEDEREPDSPTDLTRRSKKFVLRKTLSEFSDDQCTDLAAALTYYAVLALFPAAIALTSIAAGNSASRVVGQRGGQVGALVVAELRQRLLRTTSSSGARWGRWVSRAPASSSSTSASPTRVLTQRIGPVVSGTCRGRR